jgi:hypothetical protein
MASSPKQSCTEFNVGKFDIYTLEFTQQIVLDTLKDKSKPISSFVPIIEEYLNNIIEKTVSKRFKRSEHTIINTNKAIALIDTDYPDITSTIPHVDELFDDRTDQSKRDMLFDFLGSCQLNMEEICDIKINRFYFIFLVNRQSSPVKIMFLGYHKTDPDASRHVFVDNLIRSAKDLISTTHSQQRKKETSLYRNKVVLLPI